MTDTDLLPCPVPGCKDNQLAVCYEFGPELHRVECVSPEHILKVYGRTKEEAIEKWNTRTPDTGEIDFAYRAVKTVLHYGVADETQKHNGLKYLDELYCRMNIRASTPSSTRANERGDDVALAYIAKHGFNWREYCMHVVERGGNGDISDLRSFISTLPQDKHTPQPSPQYHLSSQEQGVMRKALRKSVTVIGQQSDMVAVPREVISEIHSLSYQISVINMGENPVVEDMAKNIRLKLQPYARGQ